MCSVWGEEFDENDPEMKCVQLICGHQFSYDSWKEYLKEQIKLGATCVYATCQQKHCNVIVPFSMFLEFFPSLPEGEENKEDNYQYHNKYMFWHYRNYTDNNSNTRWCPQINCEFLCKKATFVSDQYVTCKCKKEFCFKCSHNENHDPASCKIVKDWFQKEIDESGSNDWMLAFGKKCPGCGTVVDKSFGCNHMNPPYHPEANCCKYEWCWLCQGKW